MNAPAIAPEPDEGFRHLPHNLEVEQALLGALLVNNAALDKVRGFLEPDHFYDPAHVRIYDAIVKMIEGGGMADPVKLKPYFENDEGLKDVGGAGYLVRLSSSAATIINTRDYGETVRGLALRRDLIELGEDMVLSAMEADIDCPASDVLERAEASLHSLASRHTGKISARDFGDIASDAVQSVREASEAETPPGVPTGLSDLDRRLGGLFPGDLVVVAGRPAMGKSTVATTFAKAAADAFTDQVALFFSLEMSAQQVALRIQTDLARPSGYTVAYGDALKGDVDSSDINVLRQIAENYASWPLVICDEKRMKIPQISTFARRVQSRRGLGIVIIDYLQLIDRQKGTSTIDHISECSRECKIMAGELGVPVVLLSQLSRQVEHRDNKRPWLADLRDSGTIEQDADVVMFLYRDEYYAEREEPAETDGAHGAWQRRMDNCANVLDLIIAKQRIGPTGVISFNYFRDTASIRNEVPEPQRELL